MWMNGESQRRSERVVNRSVVCCRTALWMDVSQHKVERPRDVSSIKGVDQHVRIVDLAAGVAQEAVELGFDSLAPPCRLLLEGAKGVELTLGGDNGLHRGGTESPNQLILQVDDTDIEAQRLHLDPSQRGARAKPSPLKRAADYALLPHVVESGESQARPLRTESREVASDRVRSSHWHDGNTLVFEIPTEARSNCLKGDLIADPFDQHN